MRFDSPPDEYLEVNGGPLTSATVQAPREVWVMQSAFLGCGFSLGLYWPVKNPKLSKYKICGYNTPRVAPSGLGGCPDFGSTLQGLGFVSSPSEYLEVIGES